MCIRDSSYTVTHTKTRAKRTQFYLKCYKMSQMRWFIQPNCCQNLHFPGQAAISTPIHPGTIPAFQNRRQEAASATDRRSDAPSDVSGNRSRTIQSACAGDWPPHGASSIRCTQGSIFIRLFRQFLRRKSCVANGALFSIAWICLLDLLPFLRSSRLCYGWGNKKHMQKLLCKFQAILSFVSGDVICVRMRPVVTDESHNGDPLFQILRYLS